MIRVRKPQNRSLQMVGGVLAGFGIVISSVLHPIAAIAQIDQAIVQEIVKPEEEVEDDGVFIDENPAEIDAIALLKQTIGTSSASTSLLFSNGAAGRLGPQSSVIVGQCIEVQQGLLLASGPANGCTATFEIGVAGTVYVLEVNAEGEAQVKVLEGEVKVKPMETESETTAGVPSWIAEKVSFTKAETAREIIAQETEETPTEIILKAGEKITITPEGIFGQVAELLQSDVEEILNGALFQGFTLPLPGTAALQESLETLYPDLDIPVLPGFSLPVSPPRPPSLF
ncbi:MAG: hypothetical protein AB4290_05435 [Spirulina sp.]